MVRTAIQVPPAVRFLGRSGFGLLLAWFPMSIPFVRFWSVGALSWCVLGCGGSPPVASVPPPPASAPPPAPPQARVDLVAEAWGDVESPDHPLIVRLPQARAWTVDDTEKYWLALSHARSDSSVRIRVWRAGRRAKPADCREQAQLWVPALRELTDDQRVADAKLMVPEGFVTDVELFALPLSKPDELLEVEGRVDAFGAAPTRCFAVLFTTRARGVGADRVVAERIGLWADEALPHLRMRGIAERVRPEPLDPRSRTP